VTGHKQYWSATPALTTTFVHTINIHMVASTMPHWHSSLKTLLNAATLHPSQHNREHHRAACNQGYNHMKGFQIQSSNCWPALLFVRRISNN
jgi:hypothetical protein